MGLAIGNEVELLHTQRLGLLGSSAKPGMKEREHSAQTSRKSTDSPLCTHGVVTAISAQGLQRFTTAQVVDMVDSFSPADSCQPRLAHLRTCDPARATKANF